WRVPPFSGALAAGSVWGRGAVALPALVGLLLVVARPLRPAALVPPRALVFAFVAAAAPGGPSGSPWLVA
ncbi:hypothetical protein C3R44_21270, partial [Mycobacterium tuberculosis]